MTRTLDVSTWTIAALLILGPLAFLLALEPWKPHLAEFALGAFVAMTVVNLGLILAPFVAAQHWLLRLPVAALLVPAVGILTVLVVAAAAGVVRKDELDFPVWMLAPALLALCVYLSTAARLLLVRTPVSTLIRPTPREDTPEERSRAAAVAGWR